MTELYEPISETKKRWIEAIARSETFRMWSFIVASEIIINDKDLSEALKTAAIKMEKLQELEKDD